MIKKNYTNKKGFSLVETIVAIALLSIVSLTVYSLFFSTSTISKLSDVQLRRNSLVRIIKENVTNSVRKGTPIYGTEVDAPSNIGDEETGLTIQDLSDQSYDDYSFDLKLIGTVEDNVKQYRAILRNSMGLSNNFEFQFEVYK